MNREKVLKLCIDTYGEESQVDMSIEECSELIKALLKHRRALRNPEAWDCERTRCNIAEEIADVKIMVRQLELIYKCSDEVERGIDAKLQRQLERIEKSYILKEKYQKHDRKLVEKNAANKEKNQALESIRNKYDSLIEDIEKYQAKYKELFLLEIK